MTFEGRPWNIAAFNTGGWVVDSKDASEIIHSRPVPFLISTVGKIKPIDFPWPCNEEKINNKAEALIIEIIQEGEF